MKSVIKKIIITVVIIGLIYFVYSMFFKKSENDALISGTNTFTPSRNLAETQLLGNQITQALIRIESLNLDRGVFENPIFRSLVDRSEPIIEEPVGRTNPFAPLSDTSVNVDSDLPPITSVSGGNNTNATSTSDDASADDDAANQGAGFGDLGL